MHPSSPKIEIGKNPLLPNAGSKLSRVIFVGAGQEVETVACHDAGADRVRELVRNPISSVTTVRGYNGFSVDAGSKCFK